MGYMSYTAVLQVNADNSRLQPGILRLEWKNGWGGVDREAGNT